MSISLSAGALLIISLLLSSVSGNLTLNVCCDCTGSIGEEGSSSFLPSLEAARDELRLARKGRLGSSKAVVYVRGTCKLDQSFHLEAQDSNTEWRAYDSTTRAQLVGGLPVYSSWLTPLSDPSIIEQLNPAAAGHILQLDLNAHGLSPGAGVIGGRGCRTYAEGLPQPHGGNMPDAGVNSPPGLELFLVSPAGSSPSPLLPSPQQLSLAHYPNNLGNMSAWSTIKRTFGAHAPRTLVPDALTLNRSALWAQQFREDRSSIMVHQFQNAGWADMHWNLTGLEPGVNMTFGDCGNMSIPEYSLSGGNYFFVYNVLYELDTPGEYYINRTSGMLYVWWPTNSSSDSATAAAATSLRHSPAAAASPSDRLADQVIAYASMLETPVTVLNGASNISFIGIDFFFSRGAGIVMNGCNGVIVQDSAISCVGLMAANVTDGANSVFRNVSVAYVGNGGIYLYAGDRSTLTAANHSIIASSITRYNRYTYCYTPGVVFGGVGNQVLSGTRIFDAPHQAIFSSGNNHVIDGADVSNVCQIVKDSGAWYMGRDLTYRGNVIKNSYFHDINSFFPGTPVLYADDCGSSVSVINCTFRNNSGNVAALEGGKDHVFIGNFAEGKGVHAVSKGCSSSIPYLALVPWNTSDIWLAAYPTLVPEVTQNPNAAWHLEFINNTICNASSFVDIGNASITQYNGTDFGNTVINCTTHYTLL